VPGSNKTEVAVTELDPVTATLASRQARVTQLVTGLRASHARYKAKCAEVAALRSENSRLRREVQQWKHMMMLHSEIISLAEAIVHQHAAGECGGPGPATR
jgi:hypothetical protein